MAPGGCSHPAGESITLNPEARQSAKENASTYAEYLAMTEPRLGFLRNATRRTILAAMGTIAMTGVSNAADETPSDGGAGHALNLTLRSRVEAPGLGGACRVVEKTESWDPRRTAIIVCDMWDLHHCLNATRRVVELAPRMDRVLRAARGRGVAIIHAPSSCMDAYKDHPARKRAQSAPASKNLPAEIGNWCKQIPAEEPPRTRWIRPTAARTTSRPNTRAGPRLKSMGRNPGAPWKSQTSALTIDPAADYISDDGREIWSVARGPRHRPCHPHGRSSQHVRSWSTLWPAQMARNGKNVVLMRDMTDTMYNPLRAFREPLFGHRSDDRTR